jgi:hypothetical protein
MFSEFPLFYANHIKNRDRHLFAGWCRALQVGKWTFMGTAKRGTEDHAVAFCKEVFNCEMKIGKGSVKSGNVQSLRCLGRLDCCLPPLFKRKGAVGTIWVCPAFRASSFSSLSVEPPWGGVSFTGRSATGTTGAAAGWGGTTGGGATLPQPITITITVEFDGFATAGGTISSG